MKQLKEWILAGTLISAMVVALVPSAWAQQALPKEFQNMRAKPKVTMLEFSAPWCLSCKKLKPELEALQKEMGAKLQVYHLNIEQPETEKYINMYKIESAPTFILYDAQGKQLERIERDITGTELRSLIKSATK